MRSPMTSVASKEKGYAGRIGRSEFSNERKLIRRETNGERMMSQKWSV